MVHWLSSSLFPGSSFVRSFVCLSSCNWFKFTFSGWSDRWLPNWALFSVQGHLNYYIKHIHNKKLNVQIAFWQSGSDSRWFLSKKVLRKKNFMELETPSPSFMENSIKIFHFVFRMTSLTKNPVEFSPSVVFLFFPACSSSILVISTVLLNTTRYPWESELCY